MPYAYIYTRIYHHSNLSWICIYHMFIHTDVWLFSCGRLQNPAVGGQNVSHYDPIIYQYLAIVIVIP